MTKKIPLGVDDFSELVSEEYNFLFVDKTLFIKEFIDTGAKVSLIIRPRRWGKTLNMSMIRYFFAPEVEGCSTQGLFDHLCIAKESGGSYLKHQGSRPVIFISFKDIKKDSWDSFLEEVSILMASIYSEHATTLLNSLHLLDSQKTTFKKIIDKTASPSELSNALKFLCVCLKKHYKKKVMILIDEYDTPLNSAYNNEYFDRAVDFFKTLLGSALKGNNAMEKGVLTGILRLSKNSMLSDLNNLKLYSLMDEKYSQFFGFSEDELRMLFSESEIPLDLPSVQKWYNGYQSGHLTDVYNPWSILNCIDDKGALKDYWIKTGSETLLNTIFAESGPSVKEKLSLLISGSSIESVIDDYISFDQMKEGGKEEVLWSLLWALGYLKTIGEPTQSGTLNKYHLMIPNYEVDSSYRNIFIRFIDSLEYSDKYHNCLNYLVKGDINSFVEWLQDFMLSNASYFDLQKENSYHMLMLGMSSIVKGTHDIQSNKETGIGRPDLILIPKDKNNHLGIIIEFKGAETEKNTEHYEKLAEEGLEQINQKHYDLGLKGLPHIQKILKLCLVFYGKQFVYKSIMDTI
ncbi:MAG: AAA family ATPase [Gammaproteobacteria bacterium]|nr:AAA family ATPase [Gammaproteobacteria bacterium]MBP9728662.1 AAA family ATPase [Gammaproteobacteria bacterium]